MKAEYLINRHLTEQQYHHLQEAAGEGKKILFAIVGDMSEAAVYSARVLLATETGFTVCDPETGEVEERLAYGDIRAVNSKRMYGNAILRATMTDGTNRDFFRYTFRTASLCDAAAHFANSMAEGTTIEAAMEVLSATYEKQMAVCPRCGRALSAPGVQCINCEGKRHAVAKLGSYLLREKYILIISVILSIITTTLALCPPYLTQVLVDNILPDGMSGKPLTSFYQWTMSPHDALIAIALGLIGVYVVQYVIGGIRSYMLRISGDRIVASLRNDVYEKAQHLPMRFYDKTSTGSVINRISGDTNTLREFMLRITQEVVVEFFRMIGIVVIMLVMDWRLTVYALFPVPIVVVGARIFSKKIAPYYRRIWRRWAAVSSVLTDTIPCIRVIKSFTNEKNAVKSFRNRNEEWYRTDISAGKILSVFPMVVNTFVCCGSVLIWSYGGGRVIAGDPTLTIGLLVSFISYSNMFYGPVNFFANLSDSYQNALSSAERIMDILDAEPEHDFGHGKTLPEVKGRIEFRNVNFSFDRTKKVLKNINLTIEPGDVVGIVGTTGSGKSTLVNLLLRYYDHYTGDILLDGVNIRDLDMEFYRSSIGFVQQEPLMFHDTIYNNIAYGDEKYTVEQVIHAADVANAHEFIVRQPDGYDSMLGERGVGLSGGERQRISIARAVLKNPSLLVFDEATASVDSETEHLIQEAIERLIQNRTTIMIAHRLSTLSRANKIVVVDQGEIIECGPPEELLAARGKYYRLVEIQSMSDQLHRSKAAERFD